MTQQEQIAAAERLESLANAKNPQDAANALSGPILSDPRLMLLLWIAMLLPALVARRSAS